MGWRWNIIHTIEEIEKFCLTKNENNTFSSARQLRRENYVQAETPA